MGTIAFLKNPVIIEQLHFLHKDASPARTISTLKLRGKRSQAY